MTQMYIAVRYRRGLKKTVSGNQNNKKRAVLEYFTPTTRDSDLFIELLEHM